MTGSITSIAGNLAGARTRAAFLRLSLAALFLGVLLTGGASAETRTLKFHFLHTGERGEITYKINGKYIESGLRKINHLLRDWRRDEPTKMDPQLLDLIWEVYQKSGSRDYITVISAYRSPATNSMLRKRSNGVAKNSQHTLGKALDFFLPDVKLSKLREIGLKVGAGGVGYYPTSGSPFVHMDTGRPRHWPRMSRQELVRLFPDGKTMHIPADGKPLPGYDRAMASYKARRARGSDIEIVKAEEADKPNLFERWAQLVKQQNAGADNGGATSGASRTAELPVPDTAPPSAEEDDDEGEPMQVAELRPSDGSVFTLPDEVPVPSKRPAPIIVADARDPMQGIVTESSPNSDRERGQSQEVRPLARSVSLTPGEIEDLRRAAIAAEESLRTRRPENAGPATRADAGETVELDRGRLAQMDGEMPTMQDIGTLAYAADNARLPVPRPAAEVSAVAAVSASATDTGAPETDRQSRSELRPTTDRPALVTPAPRPSDRFETTGSVPTPLTRPAEENSLAQITGQSPSQSPRKGPRQDTLELALAPPEPESAARTAIARLIDARERLREIQDNLEVAAIESQADQTEMELPDARAADPEPASADGSQPPAVLTAKWRRIAAAPAPESMRRMQMGESYLGEWALAGRHSLDEIGRLHAPAYGRHATIENRNEIAIEGFTKVAGSYVPGELARR